MMASKSVVAWKSIISPRRIGRCAALLLGSSVIGSANKCFGHAFLHSNNPPPPSLIKLAHPLLPHCSFHSSPTTLNAKPKRGSAVESYRTVAVNCTSCKHRLFRYKKKNGTKSNLIKCYVERIVYDDPEGTLERQLDDFAELSEGDYKWSCPKCGVNFGRSSLIHGLPAIKLVGGKTRMTKK